MPNQVSSVQFLADYYISQLGITLDNLLPAITGLSQTLSPYQSSVDRTTLVITASRSSETEQSATSPTTKSSSSLPLATIIAIAAAGGGGLLCIIVGLVAWCCIRRRNRKRRQGPYNPVGIALPVEHHFPQAEKPTFGSQYAPVPQNEHQHDGQMIGGMNKAFDPANVPSSPNPLQPPPPFSSADRKPIGASLGPENHRFSAATTVSPVSEQGQGQPQYQQIPHPSISEVDGDIYRGAPAGNVTEVEANSPPLNHGYEMENTSLSGVFEIGPGGESVSTAPRFNGPHEMEHRGYAQ